MSRSLNIPESLAHDWAQLADLIDDAEQRQPIPCRWSEIVSPSAWTSEDKADQADAARECLKCPVLIACRRYGLDYPKEQGVYGGLTGAQRAKQKRPA